MKVKDIFKSIEATNELQEALKSNSKASVQIYIEDSSIGHECHSLNEFKMTLYTEYNEDFINLVMNANFVKTYNNTLSTTLKLKLASCTIDYKVELFIDMGGF